MKFGVAHGNAPASRTLEILRAAEDANFDQFWMYDSHIIWQDCYSVLGWLTGKSRSDTMQFGTLVTNPVSRDPTVTASAFATLAEITGDRMICGVGRGDSVVRVMKRKPAKLADLEHLIDVVHTLTAGETMEIEGVDVQIEWAGIACAGLRRRLRPARAHAGRQGRRRRDLPGRRPLLHRVGHAVRAQGRGRGRPRPLRDRRALLVGHLHHGRSGRGARAHPLVPGARRQPHRRGAGSPQRREPAAGAGRVHPGAHAATTTCSTVTRAPTTASTSPTRSPTASASTAPRSRSRRSCASSRRSASPSSTSTRTSRTCSRRSTSTAVASCPRSTPPSPRKGAQT